VTKHLEEQIHRLVENRGNAIEIRSRARVPSEGRDRRGEELDLLIETSGVELLGPSRPDETSGEPREPDLVLGLEVAPLPQLDPDAYERERRVRGDVNSDAVRKLVPIARRIGDVEAKPVEPKLLGPRRDRLRRREKYGEDPPGVQGSAPSGSRL
jgi:hypothetical protein